MHVWEKRSKDNSPTIQLQRIQLPTEGPRTFTSEVSNKIEQELWISPSLFPKLTQKGLVRIFWNSPSSILDNKWLLWKKTSQNSEKINQCSKGNVTGTHYLQECSIEEPVHEIHENNFTVLKFFRRLFWNSIFPVLRNESIRN